MLRQLQTLQKLQKQEEKNSKLAEMRLQEDAFEKHLANVLKVKVIKTGVLLTRYIKMQKNVSLSFLQNVETSFRQ